MSNKWKLFFSYALPWASMLSIEKTGIAFATFILQLSIIGWIPAAIWAHAEMKKHLDSQEPETAPGLEPSSDEKTNNSQEIIKASKSSASKKTTAAKKTKSTTTKKTSTASKPKPKPKTKAKPKTSS